jgi:hypothetical protein
MGPWSVPIETLEIRSVPCSRVPPWHLVLAVCVLSLPPTPQHDFHGDQVKTPYELCSGRKPDLSRVRAFGCRVYVEPPRPRRPAKSEIDARTGIFLGYAQTLKNLLYFDLESHEVKSAQHARYDECI